MRATRTAVDAHARAPSTSFAGLLASLAEPRVAGPSTISVAPRGPRASATSPEVVHGDLREPAPPPAHGAHHTRDRDERDDATDATHAWMLAGSQLPAALALAQLAPPTPLAPAPTTPSLSTLARAEEVQALAVQVVERAAFWGDGTRGVARLRLGARAAHGLASATVVLEHDGERLRLRVDGASDAASDALIERLRARGIAVVE